MSVEIRDESLEFLGAHGEISIGFRVDRILEVSLDGPGLTGIALREAPVENPYLRDYGALADEGPARWPKQFDMTNWGLLAAYEGGQPVGGTVLATATADVWILQGRTDLAALWDIRVRTEMRGKGVGSALFRAAEDWSRDRGCSQLKIETQNVNVAACRFYVAMGCTLGGINRYAYADTPEETQLLWFKDLRGGAVLHAGPYAST